VSPAQHHVASVMCKTMRFANGVEHRSSISVPECMADELLVDASRVGVRHEQAL
jgi:hypothetical protein